MGKYSYYDGYIEILPMERIPEFDCHCHILPGLDDGTNTMDDSLYLAERLAAYGYKRVVCTSHSTYVYRNTPDTVIPACKALQRELDRHAIGLQLTPSLEYRLIPETWPEQKRIGLLPWEGNHILIELPIRQRTQMGNIDMIEEVQWLVKEGYTPVLAHPERYLWPSMRITTTSIRQEPYSRGTLARWKGPMARNPHSGLKPCSAGATMASSGRTLMTVVIQIYSTTC